MEKKNIGIIVIVVLALVVLCCCVFLVASGVAFSIIKAQETTGSITEAPELLEMPTREPLTLPTIDLNPDQGESPNPSPTMEPSSGIDADILAQMQKIEQEVETIRGLPVANDLDRKTLSPDQLRQRVMEDFFVDYTEEDVRQDALILNLFGLIDRDYNLYDLFVELYSEQIAGFYDDETKEMVVVQGEAFAGPERMTYAHEYTHALQDAQYDLNDGLKLQDENCELDSEYCAAVTALVEGDASFTETQWFLEYSSLKDKQEVLEYYQEYSSPIFDNTPAFLQEDLIFPYSKGLEFVTALFEEGGYAAVDNAYRNPPISTEQILHPERYPNDQPIKIELDDFTNELGTGWEEIDRNTLGEWYTYLMMAKPLSEDWALADEVVTKATEGWGGDLYLVYHQFENDQDVLIYLSEWDSQADSGEFWEAFTNYAENRWGNADQESDTRLVWTMDANSVLISRQGNQVLWIVAPTATLLEQLANNFSTFK